MQLQLMVPGHRQYIGTRDLAKYHWYATRTGALVRGGVALKNGRTTVHEEALNLGDHEARYVGAFTRDYVALPQCPMLREAIERAWEN